MMRTVTLAVLVLAASAGAQSQAPARVSLGDALQAKFEELHKAGSFPGGTAGIALADGTRLGRSVGVIDASLMGELLNGVPARLGPESKYGLGVIIRPSPFGTTYGHSGFMPGYQTEMMYFPELKTAIAVQINSSAPRSTGRPLSRFITEFAQIVKDQRPL